MDEEWVRSTRVLLCIALFVLLAVFNVMVASRVMPPTGDEPHYLVTAHSLAVDHDLSLLNNYEKKDYRAFYPGELAKRTTPSADATRELPAEGLGPSLILAAPYRFARAVLPQVWLVPFLRLFVCSITVIVLYLLLSANLPAPSLLPASFFLAAPLLFYSGQFYPEIPAALLVALSLRSLLELEEHPGRSIFLLAASAGALVWLHPKYLALSISLLVISAVSIPRTFRVYREFRTVLRVAVLLVLGAAGLLSFFLFLHREYGSWSPNRIYAGWEPQQQKTLIELVLQEGFGRIPVMIRMLFGFWIDQRFGLLIYAPVYAAALAGMILLLRQRRKLALSLTALFAVHYLSLCWGAPLGGFAPPCRHFIVLIPILIFVICSVYAQWTRLQKTLFFGLLGLTFTISAAMTLHYRMLFSNLTWHNPDDNSVFWANLGMDTFLPNLTAADLPLIPIIVWTLLFAAVTWYLQRSVAGAAEQEFTTENTENAEP